MVRMTTPCPLCQRMQLVSYSQTAAQHVVRAEFAAELDAALPDSKTVLATCEPFLRSLASISCAAGCTSIQYTCDLRVPKKCPACGVACADSVMCATHHWELAATTASVAADLREACGHSSKETLVLGSVVLLGERAHRSIVRCVLRQVGFAQEELLYWTDTGAADKYGWWRLSPQNNMFQATDAG